MSEVETAAPADRSLEMLVKASETLERFSSEATPGPWRAYGEWVAVETTGCTCGSPLWAGVPHEPGCGYEQLLQAPTADAALIVMIRNAAAPVASWLAIAARDFAEGTVLDERECGPCAEGRPGHGRELFCDHCDNPIVDTSGTGRCSCFDAAFAVAGAVLGSVATS